MRKLFYAGALAVLLAVSCVSVSATPDKRSHTAKKICRQRYKDAVRGAKYLRSHQRRARIAEARRELEECERLAPR